MKINGPPKVAGLWEFSFFLAVTSLWGAGATFAKKVHVLLFRFCLLLLFIVFFVYWQMISRIYRSERKRIPNETFHDIFQLCSVTFKGIFVVFYSFSRQVDDLHWFFCNLWVRSEYLVVYQLEGFCLGKAGAMWYQAAGNWYLGSFGD